MCSRSPWLPRKMALLSGELAGNGIILRNVHGRIKDVTDLAFFRPNTSGVGGLLEESQLSELLACLHLRRQ